MPTDSFTIIIDDLSGAEIRALLAVHMAGMLANSPPDACHFLDIDGLRQPGVTFWSIWDGSSLAGCGAMKELDAAHGEVKSMRTDAAHLGRGVGRRMLDHIVTVARERGYERVSLETGRGDAFAAAIRLYETSGFVETGPFASYEESDFSRYFTLDLTTAP